MAAWADMLDPPEPVTASGYVRLAAEQEARAGECEREGWRHAASSYRRLAKSNKEQAIRLLKDANAA